MIKVFMPGKLLTDYEVTDTFFDNDTVIPLYWNLVSVGFGVVTFWFSDIANRAFGRFKRQSVFRRSSINGELNMKRIQIT